MFKMIRVSERLAKTLHENEELKDKVAKTQSDLDYIAMMTGIELEQEIEEESSHE